MESEKNGNNNIKLSPEARIQKGLEMLKDAIEQGDAKLLKKCVSTFLALKCLSKASDVLMQCPVRLLAEVKIDIPIYSERLKRSVVLGRDFQWESLATLLGSNQKTKDIVLSALEIFEDGSLEVILPIQECGETSLGT